MRVSATNSFSLRLNYTGQTSYINKSNRKSATNGQVSFADASALRGAISRLKSFNYDSISKKELQEKLTAFGDTYNNALESGKKYANSTNTLKSTIKDMQKLSKEHSAELKRIGISFDEDGYMNVSKSAAENFAPEKIEKALGKDSQYAKELYSLAKRISKKVDVRL